MLLEISRRHVGRVHENGHGKEKVSWADPRISEEMLAFDMALLDAVRAAGGSRYSLLDLLPEEGELSDGPRLVDSFFGGVHFGDDTYPILWPSGIVRARIGLHYRSVITDGLDVLFPNKKNRPGGLFVPYQRPDWHIRFEGVFRSSSK